MLATRLPVAQWLERPTGVRKVMGSIPVGDSDFFFVPRSPHVEYSIFSYFFSELKIHYHSLFIRFIKVTLCIRRHERNGEISWSPIGHKKYNASTQMGSVLT